MLLICIGLLFISGSEEQEKWLKWYRLRLEELKAHEMVQSQLSEGFSSFHIKVCSSVAIKIFDY